MPHFIVEYSANLDGETDLQKLADTIRDTAVETGVFPFGGIRVRLHRSETCAIADSHPKNAFVAIVLRMGAGRDQATKESAAKAVFEAVKKFFADRLLGGHFMLSLDVEENNPALSFKANSVHGRLKQEGKV